MRLLRVIKRSLRRTLALMLLSLLTLVSISALSAQPVAQTNVNRATQLALEGKQLYDAGQFDAAIKVWQQAAATYAQMGNQLGTTQSRINIAEALQALGLYPRACNTLLQAFAIANIDCHKLIQNSEDRQPQDSVLKTLAAQPNSLNKAIGLRSLGDVLQKLDELELSAQVLQLSLQVAQKLPSPQDESAALLSLGNTKRALGNQARSRQETISKLKLMPLDCPSRPSKGAVTQLYHQAAEFYQQAATASATPITWVQSQLNRLSVLLETNAITQAQNLWSQIQPRINNLPANQAAVYAQINLAQNLACLKQAAATDAPSWQEIAQGLALAVRQARNLRNQRAESYALGYLGWLYAQNQNLTPAQDLTQQALMLAQAIKAPDITYQWQWQLGYLLKTTGDLQGAIAAYTEAVNTLQSIRGDLAGTNSNVQFFFQSSVEPVYRQLVDLFLHSQQTSQNDLKQARNQIEALQLAELENLLKCSLRTAKPAPIDQQVDPTAAVVYPIILDDRIEVILSQYRQPLRHYSKSLPQEENIADLLDRLRENLQQPNAAGPSFLQLSQQVYNWLIAPIETQLQHSRVKTLVFVLDGPLQNIPMAALHDGQRYLIEKYAVVISPSLQLLEPKPLASKKLAVLAAGIFQNLPGLPALPEVKDELAVIAKLPRSLVLQNQEFTYRAITNKINERPFSVVHLATHGQFSSNPNQTYIRTWDDRINVNQLKTLLQTREQTRPDAIELLVLSACESAEGDKQAVLGLAGVAVRAGARSTLATLWQVNDDSTAELMARFYQQLSNPDGSPVTKAQALQSAQLEILREYKAPFYWAPYVLVGNWL